NPGSIRLPRVRRTESYAILTLENDAATVRFYDQAGHEIEDLQNRVTL
ncbi:YfcE family phosphodiesterase, partial [Bacillus inaquosorum]|nr:YfcE family phosphodiesterase [Bacillus inaquosorum]